MPKLFKNNTLLPLIAALSNLIHLPCLSFYFFMDDFWHLKSISRGDSWFRIWYQSDEEMSLYWNMSEKLLPSLVNFDTLLYYFRPVMNLSLELDYHLFAYWAFPYHLHSLLLHVASTLLLYFLLRRLNISGLSACIVSIIFATHPWSVEPVGWISARCDLLLVFFLLTAFHFYLNWQKTDKIIWLVLQSMAFVLAIGSKESAVIYPYFLLAIHLKYPSLTKGLKNFKGWLPLLAFGTLYFLTLLCFMNLDPRARSLNDMNLHNFMSSGPIHVLGYNVLAYIKLAFTSIPPFSFVAFKDGIPFGFLLVTIFAAIAIFALLIKLKDRLFLFFAWFIFFMLPTAWIPAAGRYLYLSALGLCGLTALMLDYVLKSGKLKSVLLHTSVFLLILGWSASCLFEGIAESASNKVIRETVDIVVQEIVRHPKVKEVYLFNQWPFNVMSERLIGELAGRPKVKVRPVTYRSTLYHPNLDNSLWEFSLKLVGLDSLAPHDLNLKLTQKGPYELENTAYPLGFFCGPSSFGAGNDFLKWPVAKAINQKWITAAAFDLNDAGCPQKFFFAFSKKLDDPSILIMDSAHGYPKKFIPEMSKYSQ